MKTTSSSSAPYPGSHLMPQWTMGELPDAPQFTWRNWIGMIGPGMVMGAAAIGGGEWTLGPKVTAQYGGAMLWLAMVSILFQVFYNVEICRYTLYSGEPIFTGKFRLLPGPFFWVAMYVLVDWGSFFPYLVTNAAVPLYVLITGSQPVANPEFWPWLLHKGLTLGLFTLMLVPLIFGGKVYNSLKAVMSFKLVYVLGLLIFVSLFYSRPESWKEILSGFVQVGNVPVASDDPAQPVKVVNAFRHRAETGQWPTVQLGMVAYLCGLAAIAGNGGLTNAPISNFVRDQGWGMGKHVGAIPSVVGGRGIELSHEGCVFEVNQDSLPRWRRWVWHITREQLFVWLPACIVGVALPSILSMEFIPRGTVGNDWNLATMTAEGVGNAVANPAPDILASRVGIGGLLASPGMGKLFFRLVLLCGFIVLITSGVSTADGFVRRWVDLTWVALPRLRGLDTSAVRYVYFGVLMFYFVVGFSMLLLPQAPGIVTKIATTGYNCAFGFSNWHALAVNLTLLPKELRPNWLSRIMLAIGGCFFWFLGAMGALDLSGAFAGK